MNEFKDHAALQAHLDRQKRGQLVWDEVTLVFNIGQLMEMRYTHHQFADTFIIQELIKAGAPIRWKQGAPPGDRDCEPDDFEFAGEIENTINDHTFTVTLKWK